MVDSTPAPIPLPLRSAGGVTQSLDQPATVGPPTRGIPRPLAYPPRVLAPGQRFSSEELRPNIATWHKRDFRVQYQPAY